MTPTPAQPPRRLPGWLVHPLLAFTITRVLLLFGGYALDYALPNNPGINWFEYRDGGFLDVWTRWDADWFLSVATEGYSAAPRNSAGQANIAYFPLYPLLIQAVAPLTGGDAVAAGVLISHVAFLPALIFLYRLTALEFGEDDATPARAVTYLAAFPTAVFFSAAYAESVFVLALVACFYAARIGRARLLAGESALAAFAAAGVAGALASATRLQGVILLGVVALEWARGVGWTFDAALGRSPTRRGAAWRALATGLRTHWRAALPILAVPLGLLAFMFYLRGAVGDPLAFLNNYAEGWERTTGNPIYELFRYTVFLPVRLTQPLAPDMSDWYLLLWTFDLITAYVFLVLGVVAWRRLGASYGLYVLLGVLIPMAGGIMSMSRYVLMLFPAQMILAHWGRRPAVDRAILLTCALLLGLVTALYVNYVFVG